MTRPWKLRWSGAAAGVLNGIFGGGGGAVLMPLLQRCDVQGRSAFATSLAIMLPLSVLSAVIYWGKTDLSLQTALPYLLGGLAGGFVGGLSMGKIRVLWLRRLFALLLLYGGVKYLL